MWSKLTSAIKRPGTPSLSPEDAEPSSLHPDVMGGVYERHPNLSVFHQDSSEVPFPSPSPPPSPSKRKGLLKRMSKNPLNEHDATSQPPRLNITLPKKVKSSIHSTSTGACLPLPPHRSLLRRPCWYKVLMFQFTVLQNDLQRIQHDRRSTA